MPETKPNESAPQVQVDAGTIHSFVSRSGMATSKLQELAEALGLGGDEVSRLEAGESLSMTTAQYETIRQQLAEAYASSRGGAHAADGLWGSSSPSSGGTTTTTAPTTPTPQVPAVTTAASPMTESAAGTTAHTGSVGGGTIALRTGVEGALGSRNLTDMFAISYTGPNAENSHLLQFIWREVVGVHSDGTAHPVTGTITTTGGTYDLTGGGTGTAFGNPGQSNYNTDTNSASNPFYEAGFVANRSSAHTTIYDLPYNANDKAALAFAAGATSVVSRAHFLTFLVQNDSVTYKVETNIEWRFASAADSPARVQSAGNCGSASALAPSTLRSRFHSQFPAYNFIT